MAAAEIEEMEPEAAAADAAEAPTGDLVEEAAENGAEMDRAELVGSSPLSEESGGETALEIRERAEQSESAAEEAADLPTELAASSNQTEAQPEATPAETTPAENEAVPHAEEEKDER